MGLMGNALGFGAAAREIGDAVGGVAEVFAGNRAEREAAESARFQAVVAEQSAEFAHAPAGWFHGFVDGLNRLPRPMLAIGTLGLFVYAMVEPAGFGLRMEGLQHVPEPLWWLLGAIVSFYFGAREFHYWRGGAVPAAVTRTKAAAAAAPPRPAAKTAPKPIAKPAAVPGSLAAFRPRARVAAGGSKAADPYHNAALEEWRGGRA